VNIWYRSVKKYVPNRYTRLIRQVMRDVGDGDSHYKLLQEQIGSLFNNTKYSDVSFVLETGQTIFAHKAIISARSEHFRALFNGGFDESREEQIFIRHVKSEIFLKVLSNKSFAEHWIVVDNGVLLYFDVILNR
jgi:hypothetical protein